MNQPQIKNHFKKVDPVIYPVMQQLDFSAWLKPWLRKWRHQNYFRSLARQLISQQLSTKAADAIVSRFENQFPQKQVTAQLTLKMPDEQLRQVGISWAKVAYLKDLSQKILTGQLNLQKLHQLSDSETITELCKVKGIGPWTAEMFLIFTLGREDVFSLGDLGLRKAIIKLYRLSKATPARINKIITPWSPYKTYGSIALWHSLEALKQSP